MTAFFENLLAVQNTIVFMAVLFAGAAGGCIAPRLGFMTLLAWLLAIGFGLVVPS